MDLQHSSPAVKFESLPNPFSDAERLALFPPHMPPSPSPTVNPLEVLSPTSTADDRQAGSPSPELEASPAPTDSAPASADKKPTKKRKSWGQVLPEPKTNLPPRKRAKTEDEKEQRRVERVLRNRRAAQSSRERKRLEVEALERRNKELETLLHNARETNVVLLQELDRVRRDSGVLTRSPSPLGSLRGNPVTLSPQLFGSQDVSNAPADHPSGLIGEIITIGGNPTVDPASLSPEHDPAPEPAIEAPSTTESRAGQPAATTSPDLTQRPAVSNVGGGGPVPGLADSPVGPLGMGLAAADVSAFGLGHPVDLSAAADADRYVLESGLLASPDSSCLDDDYLVGDSTAGFENHSMDLFDIEDFINDDGNHLVSDTVAAGDDVAADHVLELQAHDPEIQVS